MSASLVAPAEQRILAGSAATLEFTLFDQNGEPDTSGTVTVGVIRGDGSVVLAAGTATTASGASRTVAVTRAQTASVDRLTATWSIGSDVVGRTSIDVVGAHWFPLPALRARQGMERIEQDRLIAVRDSFAELADRVTGVAWVPRWESETIVHPGGWRVVTSWPQVREILSVTIDGATQPLAEWRVFAGNVIAAPTWIARGADVTVTYRHGYNQPPGPLVDAALRACEWSLLGDSSGISPRALGFSNEFGSFRYASASKDNPTGLPEVDATLRRYDHMSLVI